MIPVIVWLYCIKKNDAWTAAILILSGVTDMADGFIARNFHMVSKLGKVLDPIADKLTQAAMLLCLFTRFPGMLAPFLLMAAKESFVGITGLMIIRRTGKVFGADWHGKVATWLLYAMMILHVVWYNIPETISGLTIAACFIAIAVSFVLYGVHNVRVLRQSDGEHTADSRNLQ